MAYDFEFEVAVGETKTFDLSSASFGASINNISYVGDASTYVTCVANTSDNSKLDATGIAQGVAVVNVSAGRLSLSIQITVASAEDESYLNKRGLTHFWEKIKSLFIKNENGAVTTDLLANSAVTTAKINASAITNAKLATAAVQTTNILDGAVTSDKIDWTTLPYKMDAWTGYLSATTSASVIREIDVSNFPTGAVFGVVTTVNAAGSQTGTGMFINLSHSTQSSPYAGNVTSWGKMASMCYVFTKVAGVNKVYVQGYKDNTSDVYYNSITSILWRIA